MKDEPHFIVTSVGLMPVTPAVPGTRTAYGVIRDCGICTDRLTSPWCPTHGIAADD